MEQGKNIDNAYSFDYENLWRNFLAPDLPPA